MSVKQWWDDGQQGKNRRTRTKTVFQRHFARHEFHLPLFLLAPVEVLRCSLYTTLTLLLTIKFFNQSLAMNFTREGLLSCPDHLTYTSVSSGCSKR
jgi:hypothetical protein